MIVSNFVVKLTLIYLDMVVFFGLESWIRIMLISVRE